MYDYVMVRKPASTDEAARRALGADWAKRVAKFEELAVGDPNRLSSEEVHHLRVTTRRLRASLWVVRHCVDAKNGERAHRALRDIGKALGERRMWDIALHDAKSYDADTDEIEKRMRRATARMKRTLRHGRVQQLVEDMRKMQKLLPTLMLEHLEPWLQGYEWELAYRLKHRLRMPAKRHELRIQAKKTRYVLECLGRRAPSLEKLQDHLGREHDLQVLRQIIGPRPALARDLRLTGTRADRVMPSALNSAIRQLRILQREFSR